jgi:hypothetical protein
MKHKLLQNITEYRNWAWYVYQYWYNHKNTFYATSALDVGRAIGLNLILNAGTVSKMRMVNGLMWMKMEM